MVNSLQELRLLLEILAEKGVYSFRSGDLELSITPPFALPESLEEEDDDIGWMGMTAEERRIMGVK